MNKKVLFVHDGPRWIDNEGNHFGTMVDIEMYKRYKYLGEDVSFMMRLFEKQNNTLINLNKFGLFIKPVEPFNRPSTVLKYCKSKQVIKENIKNADILVIRLPSTIGSVAMKLAIELNKNFLIEVVACPFDSLNNHSFLGKIYAPFSQNKLKKLVRNAPFVNYVTKHFLQEKYPNNKISIGLSDVIIKNMPDSNLKISHYKNINFNQIRITTLGVVNLSYKGHEHVIKAISILLKEGINLKYSIIGGGNNTRLKEIIKSEGIENQIEFIGKVAHDEVFNILDNTDLYIQPSETEGLPRALIEAMSRGCACISSDAGGMPELLDRRVIFKSKNVADLVVKINYLLDEEKLIEQSTQNFENAKQYKFEVLEKQRQAFYDEFLKSINEK
jgi:glycosyltransferase involved in cell wall biosynthesis